MLAKASKAANPALDVPNSNERDSRKKPVKGIRWYKIYGEEKP